MRESGASPEASAAGAYRELGLFEGVPQAWGAQQTLAHDFQPGGGSEASPESKSSWDGGGASHTDAGGDGDAGGADSVQDGRGASEGAQDESVSPAAPASSTGGARTPAAAAKGKARAGEGGAPPAAAPPPATKAVRKGRVTAAPFLPANSLAARSTQGEAIDVVVSTEGSAAPPGGRSRVKKYANIAWVISARPCKSCADLGQDCYRSHLDAHRTYNCRRCHLGKRRCERPDVPDSMKANDAPGKTSPSADGVAPQAAEGPPSPEAIAVDASQPLPTRGSSTRRPSRVLPIATAASRKRGAEAGPGKAEASKKLRGEKEPVEHWTVPELMENVGRQLHIVGYDLMQLGDTLKKASKSLESHSRNANFRG